jgi:hypothetical protein
MVFLNCTQSTWCFSRSFFLRLFSTFYFLHFFTFFLLGFLLRFLRFLRFFFFVRSFLCITLFSSLSSRFFLVYFAFFVFFFIYLLHFLRFCIPAPQIKLFDLASLLTCVFGYSSTFSPFPLFSRFLWLRGTWSYGSFFFSPTHFHIFSWFLHLIPRSVKFQTQKYNNN